MASLTRIFYTKSDGGTMDTMINGVWSSNSIIDFLNATAHVRTADVSEVLFSVDGFMIYDRAAGFVRKRAVWNVAPVQVLSAFLPPSLEPGSACNVVSRILFHDRERAVSKNGHRHITIPGPIDAIDSHTHDIELAVRNLFLCHTLELGKVDFLVCRDEAIRHY